MFGRKMLNFFAIILSIFVVSGYKLPVCALTDAEVASREQEKSKIQMEKQKITRELEIAKQEVQKEAQVKSGLDSQMVELRNKIDISSKYISEIEIKIGEIQDEINELNELIDKKIEILGKLMQKIYIATDASTSGIVLGAENFEDFIDKADIIHSISDVGKSLVNEIKEHRSELEKMYKIQNDKKFEAQKEIEILDNNRNELQKLVYASGVILEELQDSEQEIKKKLDAQEAENRRINSEIENYYAEKRRREAAERLKAKIQGKTYTPPSEKGAGTAWNWPVKGYKMITTHYEMRWGKLHPAIDIAGPGIHGATVTSSRAGTVIKINSGGYGGGWGNYVLVDCGDEYTARYAHLSSVSVSVGQSVDQDQIIGRVGSTGFSTGPHLHFQIEHNGRTVDPLTLTSPS